MQTGQSACYDDSGSNVFCKGTGQDGEFRVGRKWPDPRFAVQDETVKDLLTGLTWTHNANPADFPMNWQESFDFVRAMNKGKEFGFTDWRIPNRRELRSLLSYQAKRPALPHGHPFRNIFLGWYWTSTTAAIHPAYAWYVHMDGARIANAAAFLEVPFSAITTDAGVDVLSFGGTKNGMMFGEAVCFLKPGLADDFRYIRKQGMQLASKMRFISAQFIAYFSNDLWKKCAMHSNSMARKLYDSVKGLNGIIITQPVQSNGIFVIMPPGVAKRLQERFFFYPWNEETSEYRWMTSWDTTEEDIDNFVSLLKSEL